ncbi:NrsF family protein [Rhodoplanes azumiensis]|uniref:NrsF family protein n=1 Tax=Rhodoplanes azumiensis TaxID=1897628 RepID=A0ABW5ARF7_9BRAD
MKTDDLIQALVADRDTRERFGPGALAGALGLGLAGSLLLYAVTLEPRDLSTALFQPRFDFKLIVALALALAAVPIVGRLARPDGQPGRATLAVLAAPVLLAVGVLVELAVVDASAWRTRLIGENAVACLLCIPLLSAPILAAVLLFLRKGAPSRPDLAGVFAGLLGGGLGAFLYASHCPDDSPLFVAAWYPLGILVVTVASWAAARSFVRW